MAEATVRLVVNGSQEDRDALDVVKESGIRFTLVGPLGNQRTPLLIDGQKMHAGLRSIVEYVEAQQQG